MTELADEKPVEVPPPAFKLVVWCALVLSLLCFVGCFFCTFYMTSKRQDAYDRGKPITEVNENLDDVSKLNEALRYSLSIGFGALVGLVGGNKTSK
jgi:2-iminoacetate synthase ThiH